MEAGEKFSLQLSADNGSRYSTVKTWVSGTDFMNNTVYSDSAVISDLELTNQTRLLWRCNASDDEDRILFDDIYVSAGIENDTTNTHLPDGFGYTESPRIYPNPVRDILYIDFVNHNPESTRIFLYDIMGHLICKVAAMDNQFELNMSNVKPGIYLLKVVSGCVSYVTKILLL
jgi:hypothetical protein